MSRTFRNINFRPQCFSYSVGGDTTSWYSIAVTYPYTVCGSRLERNFWRIYANHGFKKFRSSALRDRENQYRTYWKQFIRDSLKHEEDGARIPVTRIARGYY